MIDTPEANDKESRMNANVMVGSVSFTWLKSVNVYTMMR